MFGSDSDRKNDRYGWIDAAAPELLRASRELVENNEASRVSDEAVAQILTAAIRLYVADLDIRIVTLDGTLLRHLTLDTSRTYQPSGLPRTRVREGSRVPR